MKKTCRIFPFLLAVFLVCCAAVSAGASEPEASFDQPFLAQITEDDPANAYVLVNGEEILGLLPLPQEGEYTKAIRQIQPDGTEWINILHLFPEGFRMEESNCEGQDCVEEGEVTLENRQDRILEDMVLCLPHRLMLRLLTREEALLFLYGARH